MSNMISRSSWMNPESEEAKLQIVGKERGAEVDTYLWYLLGELRLTDDEQQAITAQCFVSGRVSFGDIEHHRSGNLSGSPILLRLRGKLRLNPGLMIRGQYCPLYQFGHMDMLGHTTEGAVNFWVSWTNPQRPAA